MPIHRRQFLSGSTAVGLLSSTALFSRSTSAEDVSGESSYDLIVVGAGTAGLPAAMFAARRGAQVLLIDAAPQIGGTLMIAGGEICAAGTKTQARFGVTGDHPDIHFDDAMRLSNGLADPDLIRLTVDHAAAFVDWIDDRGWQCTDDHIIDGSSEGRPGYSKKRYYQDKEHGYGIYRVFASEISKDIANGSVRALVNARVSELLGTDAGAVEGVRVEIGSENHREIFTFRGRHVLVTTGGYGMNPTLFAKLIGQPAYVDEAYPHCQGDGILMAAEAGAHLRGAELHRPGSGSILSRDEWPAKVYARFDTRPQKRMPWEVWVNDHGRRYVNEETPLRSPREQALLKQPRLRYSIIFDDEIFNTAPVGIPDWSRDKMAAHFNTHKMFHKADTLEELAKRAKLNPEGLRITITEYNANLSGADPFGRQHRPLEISRPPYYAIVHHGHSATCSVGVTVNSKLEAVTASGEPIPGLYAAGEVLGSGATVGNAAVPGMMITPAMTLGKLLGETLPLLS